MVTRLREMLICLNDIRTRGRRLAFPSDVWFCQSLACCIIGVKIEEQVEPILN